MKPTAMAERRISEWESHIFVFQAAEPPDENFPVALELTAFLLDCIPNKGRDSGDTQSPLQRMVTALLERTN